jgi:hypothetical protein
MAVIVTDTRTVVTEADNATGWNTGTAGTTTFVESPNSIISTINIDTGQIFFTSAASNLSNTLIYVWANNFALQDSWLAANPPLGLHIGDGTNRISFRMSGRDRKVFAHLSGQLVDWECLVLDGSQASVMNTNGLTVNRAGTFASLNLNSITQIGADFTTLSKGLGGGVNVAVDIIRVGNGGLVISGGSTSDRGRLFEIVDEDRSTANLKAHGIIREYTSGLYGIQGPITFGNTTTNSWFDESNSTLAYEARDIGNDKYFFRVQSGASNETHFFFRGSSILTAGPFVTLDFSSNNINTLQLINSAFRGLGNSVTFGTDTASESHIVRGNTFDGVGQLNPGLTDFDGNTISNSTDVTGAVILNNAGQTLLRNTTISSNGTGHGILLSGDVPSTITLDRVLLNGFGGNDTTDASIFNNTGRSITINITGGGSTPTVRNGIGSTTTIIAAVNVRITGLRDDTEVRVYPAGQPGSDELAGIETVIDGDVDDRFFEFTLSAGTVVDIQIVSLLFEIIRIENYVVPTADASIPIQQRFDRNYIPTI